MHCCYQYSYPVYEPAAFKKVWCNLKVSRGSLSLMKKSLRTPQMTLMSPTLSRPGLPLATRRRSFTSLIVLSDLHVKCSVCVCVHACVCVRAHVCVTLTQVPCTVLLCPDLSSQSHWHSEPPDLSLGEQCGDKTRQDQHPTENKGLYHGLEKTRKSTTL